MATTLSSGSFVIVLPSPDFDNSEKIEFDRINRKTRGGDIIMFRDPNWTHSFVLSMRFSYATQRKVNDLIRFLEQTLGQLVTLVDFEGNTWSGVIITPAGEVSQPGRENYSAQFDFLGHKV